MGRNHLDDKVSENLCLRQEIDRLQAELAAAKKEIEEYKGMIERGLKYTILHRKYNQQKTQIQTLKAAMKKYKALISVVGKKSAEAAVNFLSNKFYEMRREYDSRAGGGYHNPSSDFDWQYYRPAKQMYIEQIKQALKEQEQEAE